MVEAGKVVVVWVAEKILDHAWNEAKEAMDAPSLDESSAGGASHGVGGGLLGEEVDPTPDGVQGGEMIGEEQTSELGYSPEASFKAAPDQDHGQEPAVEDGGMNGEAGTCEPGYDSSLDPSVSVEHDGDFSPMADPGLSDGSTAIDSGGTSLAESDAVDHFPLTDPSPDHAMNDSASGLSGLHEPPPPQP